MSFPSQLYAANDNSSHIVLAPLSQQALMRGILFVRLSVCLVPFTTRADTLCTGRV